jgi:hypothetical protein
VARRAVGRARDRLGPVVIRIPENPDRRYYSVAVLDAFMNNVAHLGPKWTGKGAGEHLLVGPDWDGATPGWAASVVRSPTVSACCTTARLWALSRETSRWSAAGVRGSRWPSSRAAA